MCTELGSGDCYQGQYCNIETCDAGAGGKCKNVGEMCLGCTPECGCDGVTYETKHARMKAGAAGYPRILLRGSDSPLLGEAHLREVLGALDGASLAVTPDQGGGYALIGLRGPVAGLFHHPMSTPEVLAETLRRAEADGLEARTCGAALDLDTPGDLELLRSADPKEARRLCPRTLSFLSSRGL
mgnify:CR=1 FL=1